MRDDHAADPRDVVRQRTRFDLRADRARVGGQARGPDVQVRAERPAATRAPDVIRVDDPARGVDEGARFLPEPGRGRAGAGASKDAPAGVRSLRSMGLLSGYIHFPGQTSLFGG